MSFAPLLPFATIEQEFNGFGRPPNALRMAGAAISAALPSEVLSPGDLRRILLEPSTGYEMRDAILRWLVCRAQSDGGRWTVVVIGMLLPGLRSKTACLEKWCPSRAAELQAEVVDAVVEAVIAFPPAGPRLPPIWCGPASAAGIASPPAI